MPDEEAGSGPARDGQEAPMGTTGTDGRGDETRAVPVTDAAARLRRRARVLRGLMMGLAGLLVVLVAVSVATRGTDADTGTRGGTITVTAPAVSAKQDGRGGALDCKGADTDAAYAESQHEPRLLTVIRCSWTNTGDREALFSDVMSVTATSSDGTKVTTGYRHDSGKEELRGNDPVLPAGRTTDDARIILTGNPALHWDRQAVIHLTITDNAGAQYRYDYRPATDTITDVTGK